MLAQRALSALAIIRSFLLLEDDYDVDWEVDWNEHARGAHPHQARLRRRGLGGAQPQRRPGQPAPALGACLSAIAPASPGIPGAPRRNDDGGCARTSWQRAAHAPEDHHVARGGGSRATTGRHCS